MRKEQPMDPQLDLLHEMGYETRDVALNTIFKWIIGLFVFIGVTSVATLGLYLFFVYLAKTPGPSGTVAMPRRIPPDPNPIVQGYPVRDIIEFRKDEDEKLNSPQWKDRDKQIVAIPVSRAMELVLQRGLPARGQPANAVPQPPPERDDRLFLVPPRTPGSTGQTSTGSAAEKPQGQ